MNPEKAAFPYLIHTNFELGLMLRGDKPLARFSRYLRPTLPVLERYFRMFDRHVANGTFVKRVVPLGSNARVEDVYYALPDQEWRIEAMIALWDSDERWTLKQERLEGELLGYSEWQNDYWIEYYATRADR